ncbi:MAG: hypothetical protein ACE5HR_00365 [bacterium]
MIEEIKRLVDGGVLCTNEEAENALRWVIMRTDKDVNILKIFHKLLMQELRNINTALSQLSDLVEGRIEEKLDDDR